uniref:Uncharacterized protein n=1 Tax=Kalanchoe fedtschenkoi TaxID=63787 RepID=A0A7N0TTI7_KALFE
MANKASSIGKASKEKAQQHIDNIPKYSQQRRSPAPRRRTDFSQFFQSSSSSSSSPSDLLLHQGPLMKSVTDDESPSSGIITFLYDCKSQMDDLQKLPLSNSDLEDKKQLLISDKPQYSPNKQDSQDSVNMHNESPMRRSSRARKISVRFDKETIPSKSTKQARRTKILRYLGLAAPAGSPYAHPKMIFD